VLGVPTADVTAMNAIRPVDVSSLQSARPVEAAAWAAVDELAHSYVADGEHRSLDQARADAMIDLILTPTGTATWTNGIGQQYLTHPHDHRHTAA
jgi:hypothetical protein